MAAKNILDLLDNKPNANQFDFLNKKGIRQPKSVCPDSLHHDQEGGKPNPDVARHPPLHSNS